MGLIKEVKPPFRQSDLDNRKLVIKMLRAEDRLFFSDEGQKHLLEHGGLGSLEANKVFQRKILDQFGFSCDADSLKMYRSVIHRYYRNALDYDQEVLNSVVYLRENRLLYYKTVKPKIGDKYTDIELLNTDRCSVKMSEIINRCQKPYIIFGAFSLS